MSDAGNVAWDMERYKFFLHGKDLRSVHPSLQRQSTLNTNFVLYEVMFASHHQPRRGNERIQEVLRGQRDLYASMNNQTLHLANQGSPST
jgi:alkyl sulfatase BDS1-like metallo-beta-lactamase superfamily hydrolase